MGVQATSPSHANHGLRLPVLLGLLLLSILPLLSLLRPEAHTPPPSGSGAIPETPRVAYLQFGSLADTLWLADPDNPSQRQRLLSLPHAADFGVVSSLAPDGRRFAYAALPANTKAPTADTPAGLWLAGLDATATPRLLAEGIDLLVPARWSPDGESLVFRRSRAPTQATYGDFRLVLLDLRSGGERELVASSGAALFPVGFAPDAGRFYFVRLNGSGSDFSALDVITGVETHVRRLGDGLTRDWALSPAGDRLAYLSMQLNGTAVASRAFMLDLATGAIEAAGAASADAFGPVWTPAGELVIGQLSDEVGGARIAATGDSSAPLPPATRGFDVPLAFTPAGDRVAVRSFEGRSLTAPGRSVLAVLGRDGSRLTLASGEVTFLGWINP